MNNIKKENNLLDPKHKERMKKVKELSKKLWCELERYQTYQFIPPILETHVKLKDKGFIAFLGDIHFGHSSLNIEKLKKDHALIQEYNMYVILMGDLIENYNAKATNLKISTGMQLRTQKDLAKEYLLPLKKQIIGILLGNHEARSLDTDDFNLTTWLADELEVNDLSRMNTIYAETPSREKPITIFVAHKMKGGSWHNKAYPNVRARRDHPHRIGIADITAIGHNHDPAVNIDEDKIDIRTGSYVQYDDYSQKLGYYPSTKNYLPVVWYDESNIIPFVDISHAINFYDKMKKT